MAHECVECGRQTAPGALKCPHCGADRPHRRRPVRAEVIARRRRLVLFGMLAATIVFAALTFLGGGETRTQQCRDYDAAQAQYDKALGDGGDPAGDELTRLRAELEQLRVACERSEG